ncbi:hypothetical protein KBX53_04930 [Micromonospora sp. M51]|uniref:WD40 repeat domain-containing protein n=1 Tax=Micromonospora sp. M51 TaxID=2824889 RepID=UPI001B39CA06|nr:hypothetical protein [Micromonospora sp. M51]MBQ1010296.1 hypothetical protein [Micromonospora sp. M51]
MRTTGSTHRTRRARYPSRRLAALVTSFLVTLGSRGDGGMWRDDRMVRVRYLASGAEHCIETGHWRGVRDVGIAPDASWMATLGVGDSNGDGVVQIWDPATGAELGRFTTDHRPGVGEMRIAPDGTWLATIGRYDRINNYRDPVVEVWDPATGERIDQVDTCIAGGLRQLLIGPDSTWLAVVGDDAVAVWCRERSTQAAMRIGSTIRDCAVAPRGRVIFVVSAAGLHGFDVQA